MSTMYTQPTLIHDMHVITLGACFDVFAEPALESAVLHVQEVQGKHIILNLEALATLDSRALGKLFLTYHHLNRKQIRLSMVNPRPAVREMLASENAKFGQPEVNLGIIPGYGGTQRLARLINSGRALEMILSADMIDANEALRIGLVNKVYPQSELQSKAFELASKIASKGQQAIRLALKAVKVVDEVSLQEGQNMEAALFALCCGTDDFKEGTQAFLEKRKPAFKNM